MSFPTETHIVTDSLIPRWLLYTLISSLLCVGGGLCVPLISCLFNTRSQTSSKLVNYGLSLSSGSMITTALYKMLPRDSDEDTESATVFLGMLIGMVTSLGLNSLVHAFASESMVHCAHDAGSIDSSEGTSHSHHGDEFTPLNHQKQQGQAQGQGAGAGTGTIGSNGQALRSKPSLIDLLSTVDNGSMGRCSNLDSCVPVLDEEAFPCLPASLRTPRTDEEQQSYLEAQGLACLENHVGYDLENLPTYRRKFHSQRHHQGHDHSTAPTGYGSLVHEESVHHHHHLETPFSKLLSIGMQTCVVITLHKFPEGFILYYTNRSSQVSKDFGFSIFLSLALHNFVEGFSMTLPFYAAFESKAVALLVTTILGGCSQPLGALIGYLVFKNKNIDPSYHPHMDLYLSITAGFLLIIGLQMFQTGVGFSQGHHHHQGEAEKELRENHSVGTTCLKWSGAGVLLVLASGLFK
ncbi:ZYRO0G18722p [Zygosaccharomyces rouxii]|uniref:ZYRO0G18722p n=1 Tax=Zygosaccharomyces rouxii (strain ATCC 2623 / CBS 732 / NBRC 1130 / NCYC 568 / NRRL Y-229) TaxID=559307 RepID=C5E177_ZYGRC|nr:uncharacterized protein ZYRO0G18722g [Zygosaccharomyces rouxii]KAH9202854.1 Zinc/iron permease [Zygosaccharomyces rouxii]CAR29861.1 ZYRO0G18722p [Zygosaccharomyces rouxii]